MRFDPKLGVVGDKWRGGEEVAVMRQLLQQGHTGWWVPQATVWHFIPRQRMSMAFLGRYFRGQGRTKGLRLGEDGLPFYRRPRWLWPAVVREWAAYVIERATGDAARWSRRYRAANLVTGRLFNN